MTYSLKCAACGDEKTPENVTVDLDKPLVQGANNFVVSCGADSTVLTVRAKPESEKVATLTVSTQKVFHAGQTVTAADSTATYAVDDGLHRYKSEDNRGDRRDRNKLQGQNGKNGNNRSRRHARRAG